MISISPPSANAANTLRERSALTGSFSIPTPWMPHRLTRAIRLSGTGPLPRNTTRSPAFRSAPSRFHFRQSEIVRIVDESLEHVPGVIAVDDSPARACLSRRSPWICLSRGDLSRWPASGSCRPSVRRPDGHPHPGWPIWFKDSVCGRNTSSTPSRMCFPVSSRQFSKILSSCCFMASIILPIRPI